MAKVFNSSEFSELSQMIELQINEMVSTWSGNDLKWIHIREISLWTDITSYATRFGIICAI